MVSRRAVGRALLGCLLAATAFGGYEQVRARTTSTLAVVHGRYPVGRRTMTWDEGVPDPLSADGRSRRLAVWVWYPRPPGSPGALAPYAPGRWARATGSGPLDSLVGRPASRLRVPAADGAPAAAGPFPLVVLVPGLGNSAVHQSAIAAGLAARGYVVAVPTPTGSADATVLDGVVVPRTVAGQRVPGPGTARVARTWAADERFTADRVVADSADVRSPLHGTVDGSRLAYAGHSFGGATAVQSCADDPRCVGAVDVDGALLGQPVVRTGTPKPSMILTSDGSCVAGVCAPDGADHAAAADTEAFLRASPSTTVLQLRGAAHANFTDVGAWYVAEPVRAVLRATHVLGPVDGDTALRTELELVQAFLDDCLHGRSPDAAHAALRAAAARAPAVRVVVAGDGSS